MNAAVQNTDYAAHQLLGLTLDDGWVVISKVARAPGATGSNFSVGYIVENNGRRAFLKALNFSFAFAQADFTRLLQAMTEAFNFECDILDKCAASRMDRVVFALGHGEIVVPNVTVGIPQVAYLIFEEADGDIRHALATADLIDARWKLRTLHHAAIGLWQMHKGGMAHQDVKPSNVLIFGGDEAKIADLGRSSQQDVVAPHDNLPFPGDPTYQPLEFRYGQVSPDWGERRQASDLFMLGSLALFLFGGVHTTGAVLDRLTDDVKPGTWAGTYGEARPYVRDAFNDLMEEFSKVLSGDGLSDEVVTRLVTAVRQLCEPDPALRGHPRAHAVKHGDHYSVERYVAEFNLLASRISYPRPSP